jgi:hypothetical protein
MQNYKKYIYTKKTPEKYKLIRGLKKMREKIKICTCKYKTKKVNRSLPLMILIRNLLTTISTT